MESGLVSLRAELHKKKSELSKSHEANIHHKVIKPLHKESKKSKERPCKNSDKVLETNDEESLKLEKSRKALEEKALLYDQIKNGTKVLEDDELNEKFLVDFQEKIYKEVSDAKEADRKATIENSPLNEGEDDESYKAKNSSEEWVEYTDSFGRSRMCLRKDVEYMKGKSGLGKPQNVLQEKWEKIEENSKAKNDIHYQDVLFDEARTHGTSFMPFSRDEKERESQQQFLKDLESQATKVALSKEALKRKRQKLMEERLAKVRQKKRLKMGLPVKDDDRYKTPPPSDEEDNNTSEQTKEITEVVADADSKKVNESKETRVREWDIGKPGVSSIMSQAQWIDSRRKERENEFAPPTSYSNIKKNVPYQDTGKQSDFNKKQEQRSSEFSPPATYEYYRPLSSKKTRSFIPKVDIEAAISKGLSQLRNDFGNKDP